MGVGWGGMGWDGGGMGVGWLGLGAGAGRGGISTPSFLLDRCFLFVVSFRRQFGVPAQQYRMPAQQISGMGWDGVGWGGVGV